MRRFCGIERALPSTKCQAKERNRQMDASQIKEQMEVLGSDGAHVGIVDAVEGGRLKLTRQGPAAANVHHYIGFDRVRSIEGGAVRLDRPAAEEIANWGGDARG